MIGFPVDNIEFNFNDIQYNGGIGLWVYWNGGGDNKIQTPNQYCDGNWHHIALVRADDIWTLYADGISVGSMTYAASIDPSQTGTHGLIVGECGYAHGFPGNPAQPGAPFYFDGYLEDIKITKGLARYTSNFSPPSQSFAAMACE